MIWYGIDLVDGRWTHDSSSDTFCIFVFDIYQIERVVNIDHIDGLLTPDLSADNIPV